MSRARIVFAGTPDFSVPCLNVLANRDVDVVAVYCQPDRPAGRGRAPRACPVKQRADALGLNVRQPVSLRHAQAVTDLADLNPDLMVVVAYGLLLPAGVIHAPRQGCVNVHASLLPRWRGAAPIQRAIEAGDDQTGITLMRMDEGLDTGPMLAMASTPIAPDETGGTLHDRLSVMGAALLDEHLDALLAGDCRATPQDDGPATYAKKIERAEGRIDWRDDAATIERRVRAFNPWPVCWSSLSGNEIRILSVAVAAAPSAGERPGTVIRSERNGIDVACGTGALRLMELQKPGGRRLSVGDFLNGTSVKAGDRFEAG